jgi:hypothetical protein
MQITVDSRDSLQDVLRVVGSLFSVELAVATGDADSAAVAQNGSARKRATSKRAAAEPSQRRARRSTARNAAPDLAAVRAWAREHGHQVSDRGRVPNAVLNAYRESVQGA